MTEKPIIFTGPSPRAILAGVKTMTRRVVDPQPDPGLQIGGAEFVVMGDQPGRWCWLNGHDGSIVAPFKVRYAVGDVLWVREAHAIVGNVDPGFVLYRANGYEAECERHRFDKPYPAESTIRWRSPLFMPRWASRINLRVIAVKVERLGAVSEADAIAEGVDSVEDFIDLWKSIHGDWRAETWIAAYSFLKE